MKKSFCPTCKHLWTEPKANCSASITHKCLKNKIRGYFGEMTAHANSLRGKCPAYEYKHGERAVREVKDEMEVFLL